jgi:hypothetical protein
MGHCDLGYIINRILFYFKNSARELPTETDHYKACDFKCPPPAFFFGVKFCHRVTKRMAFQILQRIVLEKKPN